MIDLIPVWETPAGALAALTEQQSVSLPLQLHEEYRATGSVTQFVVTVGDAVSRVSSLSIGGVDTPFTTNPSEGTVLWDAPLTKVTPIVVRFRPSVAFLILNGELPPGLSLDASSGIISGTITDALSAQGFSFTIRASNATRTRDRSFSIIAQSLNQPATFYLPSLAPFGSSAGVPQPYKDLGSIDIAASFSFTLDISAPDGLPPMAIVPVQVPGYFSGPPQGLALDGTKISGIVDPDACSGPYVFQVHIADPRGPSDMTFVLTVTQRVSTTFNVSPDIVWVTPEGDLGDIVETDPCYFSVEAGSSGASFNPIYNLAHTSEPLPPGITLDPNTGRLVGTMPHVTSNTRYTFTVRAILGLTFSDRTFTFRILNRWSTTDILSLSLRLRVTDRISLFPAYNAILPESMIFRPDDPSFGRAKTADSYLIKGLSASGSIDEAVSGVENKPGRVGNSYEMPFALLLGAHRFAYARDSRGNVVYEVLLRDLYDPAARAGGFTSTDMVMRATVAYPQNRTLAIYPHSLNNIRKDLTLQIGFPATDPSLRYEVGTSGSELLPLWMRSAQTVGDPTTTPGYVASIVIAYLVPGSISTASTLLRQNSATVPASGVVYQFDNILVTENGEESIVRLGYT